MNINLSGKKALVGGSTSGIGRAIAMQLADSGATVTLMSRSLEKLEAVKAELATEHSQKHQVLQVDFTDFEAYKTIISGYFEDNSVDILVNNTQGPPAGTALEKDVDDYQQAFDLLFKSVHSISYNFRLFLKKGGKFIKEDVQSLKQLDENQTLIKTATQEYKFEKSVIACGAFSKKLTDQLGEKIPLDTERGYHVHFKGMDKLISRPVIFLDRGFGMTPMNQGLRAVGTVELGGLKNPISKKRIQYVVNCAKELLPQLKEHEDEWLGFRPTLPDFLPVIGPSKNNKNIVYAFGHQHLGWTLGAITGKIVSGILANEKTNLDLSAYSSSRFG